MGSNDNFGKKLNELIERLLEYKYNDDNPIAIVGPSGDNVEENNKNTKLRVYAFGSKIADIPTKGNEGAIFCNKNYKKYVEESWFRKKRDGTYIKIENDLSFLNKKYGKAVPDNKSYAKKLVEFCNYSSNYQLNNVLFDEKECNEYLDLVVTAAFNKMKKHKSAENNKSEEKERRIQTKIVRSFVKKQSDKQNWCVVDMEYNPPQRYIKRAGKKPDIIVYDKEANMFGIIELKVDNDSCKNLGDHYRSFMEYYKDPQTFIKEIKHRVTVLKDIKLIDKNFADNILGDEANDIIPVDDENIWFGFLFVNGGEEISKKRVNEYLFGKPNEEEKAKEELKRIKDFARVKYIKSDELEKLCLLKGEMESLVDWIE